MAAMSAASESARADEGPLREAIVAAGRRLGARGLISAGEGNLSARLDATTLLITPSGLRKDELRLGDLVSVPLRANGGATGAGPRPSSDVAIHRTVYRARPEVLALVHAHLPAALALTLAGEIPDPAVLPETALFIPRLPYLAFGEMGSEELATRIGAALSEPPQPLPGAVLLERHGGVAVGSGPASAQDPTERTLLAIAEAVNRLELVEVLCRTWRDALLVRAAALAAGPRAILPAPSPSPGKPASGRSTQRS
jgi:ribulose-5-phosphate 4-epimerase/fuculose-1-phosphate aldolase